VGGRLFVLVALAAILVGADYAYGAEGAEAVIDPRRALDEAARAPATEVRVAPSPNGRLGAWLLLGPYRSATFASKTKPAAPDALAAPPPGVDEAELAPRAGATPPTTAAAIPPPTPGAKAKPPPAWQIASSGEGAIDVKAALKSAENDVIAYAAATLHVERAGRFYLLLGADDGVRLFVDGKAVLTRDDARPQRDDDDLVALDLLAGDHPLLLKLHQRDGGWRFAARIVDAELTPPLGTYLALPGTTADDARALAAKMSWVSIDRGIDDAAYKPKLTVRFLEGAPRGVPLRVLVKLARAGREALFDVDAGEAPVDAAGVGDLVVSLPALGDKDLPKVEDADWTYEISVAGRVVKPLFFPRRVTREAIARAGRVLAPLEAQVAAGARPSWLADGTLESVRHLRDRLASLVDHGDGDGEAQRAEARELDDATRALDRHVDPYEKRTGPMRRAYRSPVDGALAEFGLYVPPGYKSNRSYPLVVALHGLNGRPMAMLRWFFGGDDPDKDQDWEDRHLGDLLPLDAIVVTPSGHGNAMYRDLGEDDVMRVLDWTIAHYSVDRDRISITGPSMGGIGTAAIAFRHPDRFAAAAPLCGYHSYFVRRDVIGRPMRPWERALAEERSNVMWATNGANLPLWIVHGTLDLPESNSGVLIEKYESLGFSIKHDHPVLGHNVWQTTYEELKGAKWLVAHKRVAHPREVSFRTIRLRDGDDAWVHVDELALPDAWGEVLARVTSRTALSVTTKKVAALHLDRDDKLVDATAPITVTIDGASFTFAPSDPIALHMVDGKWVQGASIHDEPWKKGEITGPIRDAFHAPLLFVYGVDDPSQARANEEVARAWATVRWGVSVHYPIMSDAEFIERGEALANDRALFLVGNARSNRVVRALEPDLPIRVEGASIVIGAQRIEAKDGARQLGAAFIRPNPKRADRYVVVVEGIDALGTWRSLSLPDLLPDFVVYDEQVAPARGQMLLSAGLVRAAGFFANDWSLPSSIKDPMANVVRPPARSEYDATPYLP
jgi:predicted esterase